MGLDNREGTVSRQRFSVSGRWPLAIVLMLFLWFLGVALFQNAWQFRPVPTARDAMARGRYDAAARLYRAQAAEGDIGAMNSLASLTLIGLGVPGDDQAAAGLYLDAAARGHAGAQLNLGHLYHHGVGVTRNPLRSFSWYQMADIHGSPWAEVYLRHVALENTIGGNVKETWDNLDQLVAAGL